MRIRTGLGLDIHALEPGKKLIIGGVEIPFEKGFKAHSDGDVLVHALCDALLGAMGLKDIGTHFPDTDPQWKGANSLKSLLPAVLTILHEKGFTLGNMDANLILQKPKMAPYIDAIRQNLSEVLRVPMEDIAVKAKRTEECLFNPPEEAVMAWVSVLLVGKNS